MEAKLCSECKKEKQLNLFKKNPTTTLGWDCICKKCYNKKHNEYYHSHPEYRAKLAEQAKESRQKLKKEVMKSYCNNSEPFCACCGENEFLFLTIDHIDNNSKEDKKLGRRSSKALYRYLKSSGYPNGYQVLCMNCNFSKGLFGECPHETKRRGKKPPLSK